MKAIQQHQLPSNQHSYKNLSSILFTIPHTKMSTYTCTQFLNLNLKDLPSMSTTVTLSAAHFGQRDLNLFIESLETITRLEKKRHELWQLRQAQKLQQSRIQELKDERCSSPSAEEAADEPLLYLEAKCIPYAVSDSLNVESMYLAGLPEYYTCVDEAYDSGSLSPRSSVIYCSCGGNPSLDSVSDESGVSGSVSKPPVRPRSHVIKHRSTRSRIISMVLKREYAKTPVEYQKSEQCKKDRLHQYPRLTITPKNSTEQSFLDKALRYLTL
ncbi:uncharacterized protein LOC108052007 [Drosophila rhopaloa]|uniref:Uncharacterized protein LOC108052007 n=1 Tax=Drosophila rhopaloa TaxID=1041015 RepID=A0A6P4FIV4_DRORH|nr:uncharacterized protein LOC108052007 [Drosophila rhopaloa]